MWISVVFVSGQGANYWTQRAESWSDEKAMKIRWIYPTVYHTVWRESTAIFRTTLNYWWTVQMSFSSSAKNLNLLFYIHTDPIYMVSNGFYWRCLLNRYLSFLNIYYSFWNTWYKKRTFSKKIMQHCWLKHYLTHPVCFSSTQPFSNRNSPVRNILKFGPWRSFFFTCFISGQIQDVFVLELFLLHICSSFFLPLFFCQQKPRAGTHWHGGNKAAPSLCLSWIHQVFRSELKRKPRQRVPLWTLIKWLHRDGKN